MKITDFLTKDRIVFDLESMNCTKNVRHKTNIGGAFFYE
jgi:hypothetical protein